MIGITKLHRRKHGKLFLFLLAGLGLSALAGCVEKISAPIWDVELNVPVADKSYTLMDVLQKDANSQLVFDNSNNIRYEDSRALAKIVVDDKIQLNPVKATSQFSMPKINLSPQPVGVDFSLSKLGLPSSPIAIPVSLGATSIPVTIPDITDFTNFTLDSGKATLTIANKTTYNLSITINSVTLYNRGTGSTVLSSSSPVTVAPGKTGTVQFNDLRNVTITNQLALNLVVSIPSTTTKIDANEAINFTFAFSNLYPRSVTAVLPAQDPYTRDSVVTLDNTSLIDTVIIRSGKLNYKLTNNFGVQVNLDLTLPDLYVSSGVVFKKSYAIPAKGSVSDALPDLAGYSLYAQNGVSSNKMRYSLKTSVTSPSGQATLTTNDNVAVEIDMGTTPLVLKKVAGKIKPTKLNFNKTALSINFGSIKNLNAGNIKFRNFGINLAMSTSAGATVRLENSSILGKSNTSSTTATITIPTTDLTTGTTTIALDQTQLNNFINTFISKPPDSLIFTYTATVNPAGGSMRIVDTDSLYGNMKISVPLEVGIQSGTINDSVDISMPSSNRTQLDNIKSASLVLKVENGFPADVSFTGKIVTEDGRSLVVPPPNSGNPATLAVGAATVDANGNVLSTTHTDITVTLTGSDIQTFLDSKKLKFAVNFNTTGNNSSPVVFKTNNSIKVFCAGHIVYKENPKGQ